MMKARQYDRRFFSRGIQPHVYAIVESNHVDKFAVEYFCNGNAKLKEAMGMIISELHDAKEYGSILTVTPQDWTALYNRFAEITEDINMSRDVALAELLPLVQVTEALAQKYDVVTTNPPYMGSSGISTKLSDYVKKYYPDSKSDLFAVFIEHCGQMAKKNGYQAMITQHAWMFLSSFEKLRIKLLNADIVNLAHLGARAFEEIGGEVVQTTSFVMRKSYISDYNGKYCRLIEPTTQQGKEDMFLAKENRYVADQSNFSKIPGSPVAYWVSKPVYQAFDNEKIGKYAISDGQTKTGNNDKYLRMLWEVPVSEIGKGKHWILHAKGGSFRRWYGNIDTLIDWSDSAREHYRKDRVARIAPEYIWFRNGICWTLISSNKLHGFRLLQDNSTFNLAAPSVFFNDDRMMFYILGYLNSKFSQEIIALLNPTLNTNISDITSQPLCYGKLPEQENCVIDLVKNNIAISKNDWDAFETSWDFQHHPLLRKVPTSVEAFDQWQTECDDRFNQLKANEEELNRIFIDIYGLQDELTPEVEDKDVTVRKADLGRDIRSFISYAVGCMFGRYSLDVDGLVFAGGEWDNRKYVSIPVDKDNIIPICDDEYFEDDIVGLFVKFVKTVYGAETLDENLKFIADALGGKGQPKDVIRNYFLNNFYADHCKIYQKRPIYWLFDSGKKNGFKALIYMHRYQPDTIARIRTDYVHEQQARYRTAIADLEQRIANVSTGERVKLNKKLTALQAQNTEIRTYEEKIHHLADQMISINLDDGVKKNYAIFQDVLAKIK